MSVIRPADAVVHEMHGARFTSFAAPSTGSGELCVWRVELPAPTDSVYGAGSAHGTESAHDDVPRAVPHRISREEVFVVVEGSLLLTLDGRAEPLSAGDVAVATAGSLLTLENPGPGPAAAWVSTSVGLEAQLADGSRIVPPWAN